VETVLSATVLPVIVVGIAIGISADYYKEKIIT